MKDGKWRQSNDGWRRLHVKLVVMRWLEEESMVVRLTIEL